jgi:hypothetical protein
MRKFTINSINIAGIIVSTLIIGYIVIALAGGIIIRLGAEKYADSYKQTFVDHSFLFEF